MRVFAYCALEFARLTERAAGVAPLTSPPALAQSFNPRWLEGYRLLYFDLHGLAGRDYWQNNEGAPAIFSKQIEQANLKNTLVFATNCHLADDKSPMIDALLAAGAEYVIAGAGENYTRNLKDLSGATQLGYEFRIALEAGFDPLMALARAKKIYQGAQTGFGAFVMGADSKSIIRDTLEFRAYYRRPDAVAVA